MPAQWTGKIVGKMHATGIDHQELAERLNITPAYVSMILNGKREPKDAEARFNAALDELIAEKSSPD